MKCKICGMDYSKNILRNDLDTLSLTHSRAHAFTLLDKIMVLPCFIPENLRNEYSILRKGNILEDSK
jgi:hypothetical protein